MERRNSIRLSTTTTTNQSIQLEEDDESELSELDSDYEKELIKNDNKLVKRGTSKRKLVEIESSDSSESEDESLLLLLEEEESQVESENENDSDNDGDYGKRKKNKPKKKKMKIMREITPPVVTKIKVIEKPKVMIPGPINFVSLDIFFEICRQMSPIELLKVSRVSKRFRKFLLADNSQSIWAIARRRFGLPDLKVWKMSEEKYARLVFITDECEFCGKDIGIAADCHLRIRICAKCRKNNFIRISTFCKGKNELHPQAGACVLSSPCMVPSQNRGHREPTLAHSIYGFSADVYKYDTILQDLELQDEINQYNNNRSWGRNSIRSGGEGIKKSASLVEDFVQKRLEFVKLCFEESTALSKAVKIARKAIDEAERIRKSAYWGAVLLEEQKEERIRQTTREEYKRRFLEIGRSSQEFDDNIKTLDSLIFGYKKPAVTFTEKLWIALKPIIIVYFDGMLEINDGAAKRAADRDKLFADRLAAANLASAVSTSGTAPGSSLIFDSITSNDDAITTVRSITSNLAVAALPVLSTLDKSLRRKGQLDKAYGAMLNTITNKTEKTTFPLFSDFLQLNSIQKMQNEEDWEFNQEKWDEILPEINEEVQKHRTAIRIHAIKTILASTTLESLEDLNKYDDSHFSEDKFNDDFLNKPTSFLVCNMWGCSKRIEAYYSRRSSRWRRSPPKNTQFSSFIDLLAHQRKCHPREGSCVNREAPGHFHLPEPVVFALSAIIEVARLDEDNVTIAQLDAIPERLKWSNSHASKKFYSWRNLIEKVITKHRNTHKRDTLPVPQITLTVPRSK